MIYNFIEDFRKYEITSEIGKFLFGFGIALTDLQIRAYAKLSKCDLKMLLNSKTKSNKKLDNSDFDYIINKLSKI